MKLLQCICWWWELKQLSVFELTFLRLDNSSIESKEGCLMLVKLSVLLWVLLTLRVRCIWTFVACSSEEWVWDLLRNVRGFFFGGMGFLSPTSVNVETSCVVRRRGDGIWFLLSKFSSNGLWPTFSNSSVSVSDSQPLKQFQTTYYHIFITMHNAIKTTNSNSNTLSILIRMINSRKFQFLKFNIFRKNNDLFVRYFTRWLTN